MFGIPDPGIWIAYVMEAACIVFAVWHGLKYWNKDDKDDQIN